MIIKKILKYLFIAKISAQSQTAHSANLIARCGSVMFRIWMFAQLYAASYGVAGKATIGGLSVAMTIWCVMLVQSFRSATRPRVDQVIGESVRSGTLALTLNKPYSFIFFHYFGFLGRVLPGMVGNLGIGIVVAFFLVGVISSPSLVGIALGTVLLFFGYTLDFLISFLIGLAALWVEDQEPLAWIYQRIQYVFGGLIVPLALFPERIAVIAGLLPFSHVYYDAARIMVHYEHALFLRFLAIQTCWVLLFAMLAILAFRKGVKDVSLNGG
jgi:ABC-2 type transport system permease protein